MQTAPITCSDVHQVLQTRVGKLEGIGARELAQQLGTTPRQLRAFITELREQGIAVCGLPQTGYYLAETPEDVNQCCAFLRSRAMKSLSLESRLRKLSLPELLGQLLLPIVERT